MHIPSLRRAGDAFSTDSNGREVLLRRRDARPTWDLHQTAPVAGNFYPIASSIRITGTALRLSGASADVREPNVTLALVTDRPQAAASLESGSLHVLLHRRLLQVPHPPALPHRGACPAVCRPRWRTSWFQAAHYRRVRISCALQDDNRGVAEALNETMCGCTDCECPGLVARGTFQMLVVPAAGAAARVRCAEVLANDAPVMLTARGTDVLAWLLAHSPRRGSGGGDGSGDLQTRADGVQANSSVQDERQERLADSGLVLKRLLAIGDHGATLARAFSGGSLRSVLGHVCCRAIGGGCLLGRAARCERDDTRRVQV